MSTAPEWRLVIEDFLDALIAQKQISAHTDSAYRQDLRDFCASLPTGVTPELLKSRHIEQWLEACHHDGLAASSIARKLSAIRQLCLYLVLEEIRKDNPAEHISTPKQASRLPHSLSEYEVDTLITTLANAQDRHLIRLHAMLCVMYAAGLRVSELVSLQTRHIQRMSGKDNALFLAINGKGNRERLVPLHDKAWDVLEHYLAIRATFIKGRRDDGWLFPSRSENGHITRQAFGQALKKLAVEAGVAPEKVHPHALRHSFASHLMAGGADLRAIQTLLGHASITTTQMYTHIARPHLQALVETHHPLAKQQDTGGRHY